jgi:hypothetical protein
MTLYLRRSNSLLSPPWEPQAQSMSLNLSFLEYFNFMLISFRLSISNGNFQKETYDVNIVLCCEYIGNVNIVHYYIPVHQFSYKV